jgi:hypothetical protein
MAEKEDLMDETRRLADVRLFCSLLKVVARIVMLDSVEEIFRLVELLHHDVWNLKLHPPEEFVDFN